MEVSYASIVNQHIEDCRTLNLDDSELAFSIIHSAEKFDDAQVKNVLVSLPDNIKEEILAEVNKFNETGEYHVISSTGVSKDLSRLMARLAKLI